MRLQAQQNCDFNTFKNVRAINKRRSSQTIWWRTLIKKTPLRIISGGIRDGRVRPVTYLGQVVVGVVVVPTSAGDGAARRVGAVSRHKVVEGEVDALAGLGNEFDGARRHVAGVERGVETAAAAGRRRRRRGGVAVRENRHAAAADVTRRTTARRGAANVAHLGGGDRLLPDVEALVVVGQHR